MTIARRSQIFIKHTVPGGDNTFNSNPDNIIEGLTRALKAHFDIDFQSGSSLPDDCIVIGDQIFRAHEEHNGIYYGDQAWVQNGTINEVDKSAGNALFDRFLFNNKTKCLEPIDPEDRDSFPADFNRCYGGDKRLHVKDGNLYLDDTLLIGTEQSGLTTLYLPDLTEIGNNCLANTRSLTHLEVPQLETMGRDCLFNARSLTHINAPAFEAQLGAFQRLKISVRAAFSRVTLPANDHTPAANSNGQSHKALSAAKRGQQLRP